MKKQILKGFTIVALVVGIALVSAVASANGQSRTKANVPFDFIVGSQTMTAGNYMIRSGNAQGDVLRITSTDSTKDIVRLSSPLHGESSPKLVFHRYGERYFLAEVWNGDSGRSLIKSKLERAAERELARTEMKSSQTAKANYERVEVLAQLQ